MQERIQDFRRTGRQPSRRFVNTQFFFKINTKNCMKLKVWSRGGAGVPPGSANVMYFNVCTLTAKELSSSTCRRLWFPCVCLLNLCWHWCGIFYCCVCYCVCCFSDIRWIFCRCCGGSRQHRILIASLLLHARSRGYWTRLWGCRCVRWNDRRSQRDWGRYPHRGGVHRRRRCLFRLPKPRSLRLRLQRRLPVFKNKRLCKEAV